MLKWTAILAIVFVHVFTSEGWMDWQRRPRNERGSNQDLMLFHGLSGRQCRRSHVTLTAGSMTEPPEDNNDFCRFKNGVLACRRRPSMLNDANWLQNTLYDYREHPDVNGNPGLEAVLECALDKLNQLGNPEPFRSNVARVRKRAALYNKLAWGYPNWADAKNLFRPRGKKPPQKHTTRGKPPPKPQTMPTTVATLASIATSIPDTTNATTSATASNDTSETPPPITTAITTEPAKEETTSQEASSSTESHHLTPEYQVRDTFSGSTTREEHHSNSRLFIILMVGSAVIHFVLIVLLVLTARRLAKKHRRGQKQKPKPVKSLTSANFKMKEAEPLKSTETAPNQTQTVDLWK